MKNWKIKIIAATLLLLSILFSNGVLAATSQQKKIADAVDPLVVHILLNARDLCTKNLDYTSKNYKKNIRKIYNGKLSEKNKAVIAAGNTKTTFYMTHDQAYIDRMELSKVKKQYTNLFGTKNPVIKLPVVESATDLSSYYYRYAKSRGKYVYTYSCESEFALSTKLLSVKKIESGKYAIKKKYDFYTHWIYKQRGEKPSVSPIVTIYVEKNNKSSYGYNIVGLTIS
ncbi:MAG: hypothetical protein ACI4EI_11965 [Muricoprocola sp.]